VHSDDSANDLNHIEPLGFSVRRELLKSFPVQPFAQAFPPRVAQPEERGAIGMFEVAPVRVDPDETMPQQWIGALVGGDSQRVFLAVQLGIGRVGAFPPAGVSALHGRSEPDCPGSAPRPKRRDLPLPATLLEYHRHLQVGVVSGGLEGGFEDVPLLRDLFSEVRRNAPRGFGDGAQLQLPDLGAMREIQ
jgi:hypothetical protein